MRKESGGSGRREASEAGAARQWRQRAPRGKRSGRIRQWRQRAPRVRRSGREHTARGCGMAAACADYGRRLALGFLRLRTTRGARGSAAGRRHIGCVCWKIKGGHARPAAALWALGNGITAGFAARWAILGTGWLQMGRAMATARAASKASLGNVEDAASTVVSRRDGAHGGGDAAEEEAPRVRPPP